ncbi:MAG: methyltransferase domain-containing protein [Novosphingobium sp.]|nr:methyltransferase domain-containing protein [Novosphingobium sp.]
MRTTMDWREQVGQSWARMYRQTDRSLAGLTEQLLDAIAKEPGQAVLDIGCGAGELALAIARARPRAHVIGVDISPDLAATARERGVHHANAEFVESDASCFSLPGFSPDLLVSRHGVMFFDDPVAAFAHLRGQADQAARLVFSCFRTARQNPWMSDLAAMLPGDPLAPEPDPHAPGPFAFADPDRLQSILRGAGWSGVEIAPADFAYIAGHGDDPVGDAEHFFSRIGPAARTLAELDDEERARVVTAMRGWLDCNRSGDLVAFPAAAWIVSARNG